MTDENRATFEIWIDAHRKETATLIKSLEGQEISESEFIAKYKSLGIARTSPAKGKGIYRFLRKVGFIN